MNISIEPPTGMIETSPGDDSSIQVTSTPPSRFKSTVTNLGWVGFALVCFMVFTLLKLPDERIKGFVNGTISSVLASRGISFTSEKGYVSVGFGLSYVMKNVTLTFPPPDAPVHITEISVTPSLLGLLIGHFGGDFAVYNGDGKLSGSFSMKDTKASVSFNSKSMDVGKIGLLSIFMGIKGAAVLNGNGSIAGDFSVPSTLSGDVDLSIDKMVIDQQTIAGFAVPKLTISETKADVSLDRSKATIRTFRVGKKGNVSDDIQATATGDISLGRNWDSTGLNLKLGFSLSQNVLKSFVLIDALLGNGKQPDGSYSFILNGTTSAPNWMPAPK